MVERQAEARRSASTSSSASTPSKTMAEARNSPATVSFSLGGAAIVPYEESDMGKGLILWLLGVPGIVIIGLLLFRII